MGNVMWFATQSCSYFVWKGKSTLFNDKTVSMVVNRQPKSKRQPDKGFHWEIWEANMSSVAQALLQDHTYVLLQLPD